MVTELGKFWLR